MRNTESYLFEATWDLCGNNSDIEQIIGNAVPCALGEFVGRALATFDQMPHHWETPDPNVVSMFVQYDNIRSGDVSNIDLESLDPVIVGNVEEVEAPPADYEPCQPQPAQMLLAVERKKARVSTKEAARGFKGKNSWLNVV